jgi:hypothetical protein
VAFIWPEKGIGTTIDIANESAICGVQMMRNGLIAFIFCSWTLVCSAQEPPASKGATTDEQIRKWITGLGANQFDARDQAMQALISTGQPAVQPILAAAHGNDREVALRCVVALQEIGARGNTDTLQVAITALEQLSAREASAPVVARQATEARASLSVVRQERAVEFLQGLGAVISREADDQWYRSVAGFGINVFSLEIGPSWRGTEKDLERISWITDLEQVSFVGPQVKDSWFRYIQKLPKLNSVKLKRADITLQGLETLTQIEGVWFMRLLYLPLDDRAVQVLTKSRSLRKLVFISRQLTNQGRKQLHDHFGELNAECPHGALLGITANAADGESWTISQVLEGGAAAKAGILEKDRILKFNGRPVPNFFTLKEYISENQPGDTAKFEIARGAETVVIDVKFGEWD